MIQEASTFVRERYFTVPALAREAHTSPKLLRREIREGRLRAYTFGTTWPRVAWSDFVVWLRTTRVSPSAHAEARAAEIIEHEKRRRGEPRAG